MITGNIRQHSDRFLALFRWYLQDSYQRIFIVDTAGVWLAVLAKLATSVNVSFERNWVTAMILHHQPVSIIFLVFFCWREILAVLQHIARSKKSRTFTKRGHRDTYFQGNEFSATRIQSGKNSWS